MRAKKSILSLASNWIGIFLTMMINFIVTPLILKFVGAETYGAYRLLLDFTSYFALIEFGFYGTTQIIFSKEITEGDGSNINALLKESFKKYSFIVFFTLLAIVVSRFFLVDIINLNSIDPVSLNITFFFILLLFSLNPFGSFQAYIEADQRSYLVNLFNMIQKVTTSLISVYFCYLGFELYGLFASLLIARALFLILCIKSSNIGLKEFIRTPSSNFYSEPTIKQTRRNLFLFDISGRINLSSDAIILSSLLDLSSVSTFYLTSRLVSIFSGILQSVGGATWAGLANMYYLEEHENFREKSYFLVRILSVLSCMTLLPLFLLNKYFISLWVGEEFYVNDYFTLVLIANAFLQSLMSLWGWMFSSTNNTEDVKIIMIINTVLNLGLSILFTIKWGIIGPILGTLVATLSYQFIALHLRLRKTFKFSIRRLIKSWSIPLIYFLAVIFSFYHFKIEISLLSWPNFIIKGLALGLTNAIIVFLLFLNHEQKSYLLGVFKKRT
jgi:O-antigen/teichoic acid export membrane protein